MVTPLTEKLVEYPEPMLEREVITVKVIIQCFPEEFTNRFSTSSRLQRRAPDCLRFAHKAKKPTILCCVITQKNYNKRNPSLVRPVILPAKN